MKKDDQIKATDVITNTFPQDNKNMLISDDFKRLIIIPEKKTKKEAKPKAEKPIKEPKTPKPKGKKATSGKVIISNAEADTKLNMN